MFTIKQRIVLASTCVFGVVLVLFSLVIYRAVHDEETSKLEARLEAYAEKLDTEIEEQLSNGEFPDIAELSLVRIDGLVNQRFQVYDALRTLVVADSLLSAIPPFLWPGPGGQVTRSEIQLGDQNYLSLQRRIEPEERTYYILQVAASTEDIEAALSHLQLLFVIVIPATLLLMGSAAYVLTRSALRPLTSMVQTAREISASTLHERLTLPKAQDEVRVLGETLNNMIERLDAAFKSQKQFVADASHELRTPLTVIRSELEFAQRHIKDTPAAESIDIALSELDRLASLAEKLLLLTRLDASQPIYTMAPVRLDEIVVESLQLMKGKAANKRIALNMVIDAAVEIEGDRALLKSVFLNLFDNAIKYSHPGETVSTHLTLANSKHVLISIEDHGVGIAPADLPHIFKRFYQSDTARADGSGFGIGLAMVDRIVELHKGTITVRSKQGEGSTFVVKLPVANRS